MIREILVVVVAVFILSVECSAMQYWAPMQEMVKMFGKREIKVLAGVELYNGEIIPFQRPEIRLSIVEETAPYYHWSFRYLGENGDQEGDWQLIGNLARNYFVFPDDLGSAGDLHGLYELNVQTEGGERVVKIMRHNFQGIELAPVNYAFPEKKITVSCVFTPALEAEVKVVYHFSEPAFVRNRGEGKFEKQTDWEGGAEIEVYWDTPGEKRIEATYDRLQREETVNVIQPYIEENIFSVLVNRNDSDNDGQNDLEQEKLEGATEDPELLPLNLRVRNPSDFNELIDPADQARLLEAVAELKLRRISVQLDVSPGLRIFSSRNKGEPQRVIYHDTTLPYAQDTHGRSYYEHRFADYNDANNLAFLRDLYIEGYSPCKSEVENWITITWRTITGTLWIEKIPVDILHIRMNYAPGLMDINKVNPMLTGAERINWIWNPAFVPIEDWNNIHVGERVEQCAVLKLDALGRDVRPWMDHDMIEWRIVGTEDPARGNAHFLVNGENAGHKASGLQVNICGTRPGILTVQVGLKDFETSYLRYRVMVGEIKEVPSCFQFFHPNDYEQANNNYYPNYRQFAGNVPKYVRAANIFLRQAGLKMTPINNINALEVKAANPVKATILRLEGETLWLQKSSDPESDPRLLLADYLHPHPGERLDFYIQRPNDPHGDRGQAFNMVVSGFSDDTRVNAWKLTHDRDFMELPPDSYLKISFPREIRTGMEDLPKGVVHYYNVPAWVTESFPVATMNYGRFRGACNFNIVKQMPDLKDRSALTFAKPRNGYSNDEEERQGFFLSEHGAEHNVTIGRAPTSAYGEISPGIGVALAYPQIFEKMEQPHPVSTIGNLLAHHLLKGLGLINRKSIPANPPGNGGSNAPKKEEPCDGIVSVGFIPTVDIQETDLVSSGIEGSNAMNLMFPKEHVFKCDIDLIQTDIARHSELIVIPGPLP